MGGYSIMNIVTPDATGSVRFSVRTRPTQSYATFSVKLDWTNEENNVTGSQLVTASYDSNDFLNVTASALYASASNFFAIRLVQMSGSVECNELYRGELFPTTQSATERNSVPFYSWTGSNDTYIIF